MARGAVRAACRRARAWSGALALVVSASAAAAPHLGLPTRPDSVKFVVIGDFGTGDEESADIAARMSQLRSQFPFEFVITTGDNMLGSQDTPADFEEKFARPFALLLRAGVRFYASLGNHDAPSVMSYAPWNMHGQRYYTYARRHVRFVVLDSNRVEAAQLEWLEQVLRGAREPWKICYFHHPLYSNGGRHGPELELRVLLEPLLVRYGVHVVFSGHQHVYERLTPQKGVQYFVTGAGGQPTGRIHRSGTTAASFGDDQSFMAVEVTGDRLHFRTVSRTGLVVDGGEISRRP
jgi:hypothetical protein